MKANKIFKLIFNGILIPLAILAIVNQILVLSGAYYWDTLDKSKVIDLTNWLIYFWIILTTNYIGFLISFYTTKKTALKLLWTIVFLSLPILIFNALSIFDYRVNLIFAISHLSYYVLFFISNSIFYVFLKIKQLITANKNSEQKEWSKKFIKKTVITLSSIVLAAILFVTIVLKWKTSEADKWFDNDKEYYMKFANSIDHMVKKDLTKNDMLILGMEGYPGELLFITYLMSSIGYGQIIMQYPELKEKYIGNMEYCIDKMISDKEVKSFDADSWDEDPIQALYAGTDNAHGAYFCYFNIAISMHNLITENSKYSELNKKVTEHLVKQFNNSPIKLIETFPGSYFPADVSAAIGSIGLYTKATGIKYEKTINQVVNKYDKLYSGNKNGLVVHIVYPEVDTIILGDERGASTALCSYMISFADKKFSKKLFNNMKTALYENKGLYAGIREYPREVESFMDGDSGPIVDGLGVSASGFALGAAKRHNDKEMFTAIYQTAGLVGGSDVSDNSFEFSKGAIIGNAIMFAMLTAQ